MLLCCIPLAVSGGPAAIVLWDESVDGDLPYNLNALSDQERERFTFYLSAHLSKVVGQSVTGERFLVVVPAEMELVEVRVRFDNTISGNAHVLLIEPYPYGSTTAPCLESQTYISINEMETVGPHSFSHAFVGPGAPAKYFVSSTMAVSGLSVPAPFDIEFVVSVAPIFHSGFSCRQFPNQSGG
jgi:hypothetical protein